MAEETTQAKAKKVETVCVWRGRREHVRWASQEVQANGIGGNMRTPVPKETINPGDKFTPTNREAYSFRNLIELNGYMLDRLTDEQMAEAFGINEADPDGTHWMQIRNTLIIA